MLSAEAMAQSQSSSKDNSEILVNNYIRAYATPCYEPIVITLDQIYDTLNAEIRNHSGLLIKIEQHHNVRQLRLHTSLPSGHYFLRLSSKNRPISIYRLIIK